MLSNKILIDFVAGCHGHFLETILNKYFNIAEVKGGAFTTSGTSHITSSDYVNNRLFHAEHWSERHRNKLKNISQIISIRFDKDDLLLVSSVSLLRAADLGIDNNQLEVNTVEKLNNPYYCDTLLSIYSAYPFLRQQDSNIPRYVLREFFKFGFRNPESNGYWRKQQELVYNDQCKVFYFEFKDFYNIKNFVNRIQQLELFLNRKFDFSTQFYKQHEKFISHIPFIGNKEMCDNIIACVCQDQEAVIPKLTLFQESYINGQLENIFQKEMPFHQDDYFTSTKDMLFYINNHAPSL